MRFGTRLESSWSGAGAAGAGWVPKWVSPKCHCFVDHGMHSSEHLSTKFRPPLTHLDTLYGWKGRFLCRLWKCLWNRQVSAICLLMPFFHPLLCKDPLKIPWEPCGWSWIPPNGSGSPHAPRAARKSGEKTLDLIDPTDPRSSYKCWLVGYLHIWKNMTLSIGMIKFLIYEK